MGNRRESKWPARPRVTDRSCAQLLWCVTFSLAVVCRLCVHSTRACTVTISCMLRREAVCAACRHHAHTVNHRIPDIMASAYVLDHYRRHITCACAVDICVRHSPGWTWKQLPVGLPAQQPQRYWVHRSQKLAGRMQCPARSPEPWLLHSLPVPATGPWSLTQACPHLAGQPAVCVPAVVKVCSCSRRESNKHRVHMCT